MSFKVTRSYAVLEVPAEVYDKIRELLVEAGYEHTFHINRTPRSLDEEVIDMNGIALKAVTTQ